MIGCSDGDRNMGGKCGVTDAVTVANAAIVSIPAVVNKFNLGAGPGVCWPDLRNPASWMSMGLKVGFEPDWGWLPNNTDLDTGCLVEPPSFPGLLALLEVFSPSFSVGRGTLSSCHKKSPIRQF